VIERRGIEPAEPRVRVLRGKELDLGEPRPVLELHAGLDRLARSAREEEVAALSNGRALAADLGHEVLVERNGVAHAEHGLDRRELLPDAAAVREELPAPIAWASRMVTSQPAFRSE
jgi:hypothetical protein